MCGVIAGLFVTAVPVAATAAGQNNQNQSNTARQDYSKQLNFKNQSRLQIQSDGQSNHNYSILPQKQQVFQEHEQPAQKSRKLSSGSR